MPLTKIGRLVTLEDSLYNLEYVRYVQGTEPTIAIVMNDTSSKTNADTETYSYHKVRSGETLSTIASRYGTTVEEIQRVNGMASTKIYVGQRLKVKGTGTTVGTTQHTPEPIATKKY